MSEDKKERKLKKQVEDMFDLFVALDILEQKEKNGELIFKLKDLDATSSDDLFFR